jgi:hypothetical protein
MSLVYGCIEYDKRADSMKQYVMMMLIFPYHDMPTS